MTEATLAVLNMEIRAKDATTAAQQLERLTKAASDVDAAFGRAGQAASTAGAATGRVEQSLRPLIAVYGQARDALGRFTDQDGSFRHSQDATAKMLLQNAKTVEAYERQIDKAAKQVEALTRAYDPVAAEIMKTNRQIEQASKLHGDQSKIIDGLKGKLATLEQAHTGAANGAKLQSYQLLNLGRQFTDVGVSIASGQPVWMVAIQQGAQIGEVFAEAKTQGVSLKSALGSVAAGAVDMAKKFAPLIGTGAILGGVALAAYGVWTEIQKTKQAMKDLESATLAANAAVSNAREAMKEASLGAGKFGEDSLGAAFGIKTFAGEVGDAAVKLYDFAAASKAATINGLMAQRSILGTKIEGLEARSEQGRRSALTGRWTPARIAGKLGNRIGGDLLSLWTGGESDQDITTEIGKAKDAMRELEKATVEAGKADPVKWADEARAALGDLSKGAKKAKDEVKELAGLKPFDESKLIQTTEEVWPYMAGVIQATEKRTRDLNAATQELDHSLSRVRIPSDLENLATVLDDQSRAARELRFDIEDIAGAINNNDWTSAFAGLINVLAKVDVALGKNATSLQKMQALAGVGMGVGSVIGGTAGAGISGGASGALGGFSLVSSLAAAGTVIPGIGNVAGAVIGGLIGGIGSIFGSSKAKKKAKAQAAAQAAAEAAQREQTIADTQFGLDVAILRAQGKEQEALTKERDKEIARLQALSPALVDSQKQLWALEDAATAAAAAAEKAAAIEAKRQSIQDQIDKLTLSDSELLAKTRAKERAEAVALDPALGDLIDKLYGLQDSAAASEKATAALQAANDAATKAIEAQAAATQFLNDAGSQAIETLTGISKSLREFAGELDGTLGRNSGYDAARAALLTEANSGRVQNLQALGEAFLKASGAKYGNSRDYQRDAAIVRAIALAGANTASERLSGVGAIFGNLPGFATGGSMVVGGNPGVDQNLLSLNGAPLARVGYGETLSVKPRGASNDNSLAELKAEFAAMRAQLADIAASNNKMERTLTNVTEGGRAMQTEAAS